MDDNWIEIIRRLIEEAEIPLYIIAKKCKCTPTCIQNYLHGRSTPNKTKRSTIYQGLKQYRQIIDEIIDIQTETED